MTLDYHVWRDYYYDSFENGLKCQFPPYKINQVFKMVNESKN